MVGTGTPSEVTSQDKVCIAGSQMPSLHAQQQLHPRKEPPKLSGPWLPFLQGRRLENRGLIDLNDALFFFFRIVS